MKKLKKKIITFERLLIIILQMSTNVDQVSDNLIDKLINHFELNLHEPQDFIIKLSDGVIHTHKNKLLSCDYFKTYLSSDLNTTNELKLSDSKIAHVKPLINFIHFGNDIYNYICDKYLQNFEFDDYMEIFKFANMWLLSDFINLTWPKLINQITQNITESEIDIIIDSTIYYCNDNTPKNIVSNLEKIICQKGISCVSEKIFDSIVFKNMSGEFVLYLVVKYNRFDKLGQKLEMFSDIRRKIIDMKMEKSNYLYSFITNIPYSIVIPMHGKKSKRIDNISFMSDRIGFIKSFRPFEFTYVKCIGSSNVIGFRSDTVFSINEGCLTFSLFTKSSIKIGDKIILSHFQQYGGYQGDEFTYRGSHYFLNIIFEVKNITDDISKENVEQCKNKYITIIIKCIQYEKFNESEKTIDYYIDKNTEYKLYKYIDKTIPHN